jgi:hypothetical protein
MQKQIWDGSNWVGVDMCENARRNTDVNYGHGIGVLQCYDEPAEFEVTVDYGYEKSPPMKLCGKCLANLKKSAHRNGYKVKSTRLRG